jgi:hypothetical protein
MKKKISKEVRKGKRTLPKERIILCDFSEVMPSKKRRECDI